MTAIADAPPQQAQQPAGGDAAPTRWGRGGPVRRYAPLAAILLAIVVLAIVTSRTSTGLPLDPSSVDPDGTKALVLILEEVGADVTVLNSTEDLDVDTLLVLVDNLGETSAGHVQRFVEGGGTALVADSSGILSQDLRPARAQSVGFFEASLPRRCEVAALDGVARVRTGASTLFAIPDDAEGCFVRDEAAWLIIRERGDGMLVTAGAPTFLINSMIGEVDNAGLAAAVLAPRPGTRVGVLRPSFAAPGEEASDQRLMDLVPGRIIAAAFQLMIAFGVVVLWRMRRLGKPVAEPQAVQLVGSELVIATGNLLQRTGSRGRAAELLRDDFRRTIVHHLGIPQHLPVEELADLAAQRTGADRQEILDALTPDGPATDADLVALAQRLEHLRDALSAPVPTRSHL